MVYIDDILIFLKIKEKYERYVREILERLYVMISAEPGLRNTQAPRTLQTTKGSRDVDIVDMEPRHYGHP